MRKPLTDAQRQQKRDRERRYYARNKEHLREVKRVQKRERYAADPTKRRNADLKRIYGITREQHDALFATQGQRCAICSADAPVDQRGWVVDHCHATENVRGILCNPCNVMLGMSKDRPEVLRRAATYLESVSWQTAE